MRRRWPLIYYRSALSVTGALCASTKLYDVTSRDQVNLLFLFFDLGDDVAYLFVAPPARLGGAAQRSPDRGALSGGLLGKALL